MNCKNILIVSSEFPPQPGGIGNHALNLAMELSRNKKKVTVLTDIRSNSGIEEQAFDDSLPFKVVRVRRYRLIVFTYLKRIFDYRKLRSDRTQVIASGKFSLWMVGFDLILEKKMKFAVIHGSEVNLMGFQRKLTNIVLKKFNQIVAVSNYTKSLIDHLSLSNIQVISNGFHIKPIGAGYESKEKVRFESYPNLITVGNVTERKGQLNIIKALPKLIKTHSKIHYHIVGLPTEQLGYYKIACDLGVENYLTFHGKVSEELKYELLQQCDIFVMLSNVTLSGDVEGFGIAILEANAMGLPAIGANTSGIVDAIQDNYSGKLIDPKNIKSLDNAISSILKEYQKYSNNSIEWASHFTWKKIIQKYKNVIE